VSDERTPSRRDAQIAEVAAQIAEVAAPAPFGTLRLVEAALHAPAPPAEAEEVARGRALSAFEESRLAPRALHAESWGESPVPLLTRLGRFVCRLWRR
jgi:hypothetical protein